MQRKSRIARSLQVAPTDRLYRACFRGQRAALFESRSTGFQPVSGEDRQDACPTTVTSRQPCEVCFSKRFGVLKYLQAEQYWLCFHLCRDESTRQQPRDDALRRHPCLGRFARLQIHNILCCKIFRLGDAERPGSAFPRKEAVKNWYL